MKGRAYSREDSSQIYGNIKESPNNRGLWLSHANNIEV